MHPTKVLFSGMIFFQFFVFLVCSVLAIGSVEHSLQTVSFEFVSCFTYLLSEFILIFALCHYATHLTNKSIGMGDVIYNCPWYLLPLQQQKMIILMVRHGHVPFVLDGYKIFPCSKESFVKVKY